MIGVPTRRPCTRTNPDSVLSLHRSTPTHFSLLLQGASTFACFVRDHELERGGDTGGAEVRRVPTYQDRLWPCLTAWSAREHSLHYKGQDEGPSMEVFAPHRLLIAVQTAE